MAHIHTIIYTSLVHAYYSATEKFTLVEHSNIIKFLGFLYPIRMNNKYSKLFYIVIHS